MQRINLGTVIDGVIARFSRNRVGDRPPICLMVSAALSPIFLSDRSLAEFVRIFVYETLLTNEPDATLGLSLRRRVELRDLSRFVGIEPSYWIQLRAISRGLKITERQVEELFGNLNYCCEEWVGHEAAIARLGIFAAVDRPELKIVIYLESTSRTRKYDLLLPIHESFSIPRIARLN